MVLPLATQLAKRQAIPIWRSTLNIANLSFQQCHLFPATLYTPISKRPRVFSSTSVVKTETSPAAKPAEEAPQPQVPKRKIPRSPAGKRSLRRVAVEAERSRDNALADKEEALQTTASLDGIIAICVAEEFNMDVVVRILRSQGYPIDPQGTSFLDEQVVHTRGAEKGDIFIFPSGTVVSWSVPSEIVTKLASETLKPAMINPHIDAIEVEDLDYTEDPSRDSSSIRGDVVTLGTKKALQEEDASLGKLDTTLAQIAFSSGLARSTKLAVLETSLSKYISSTRSIPILLSKGSRLPFSRTRILQKIGELLVLRAQLNHYSELTDSLPDLFWDSPHQLGLEGYYDQVGKALDVGVRIKTLNQKMDYALETGSVLRATLSEKHSIHLEWIIIILIAVEVGFALRREWKERAERLQSEGVGLALH